MYSPGESRSVNAGGDVYDRIVAAVWTASKVVFDLVGLFYWAALVMFWVIAVAQPT